MELREDGHYVITGAGSLRFCGVIVVGAGRFAIAAFLIIYGSLFLAYTISIADLVLNAVALEFILNIDELIYSTLAPIRTKTIIPRIAPFSLTHFQYGGMDSRSVLTVVLIIASLSSVLVSVVQPQLSNLRNAKAAICGGDTYFVYAIDQVSSHRTYGLVARQAQSIPDLHCPRDPTLTPITMARTFRIFQVGTVVWGYPDSTPASELTSRDFEEPWTTDASGDVSVS